MPNFRTATFEDIEMVLPLMREFYEFESIRYDAERALKLLSELLRDSHNGRLIIIGAESDIAGYLILGFGFSVEFGGRDALLDELFIRTEFRGRGFGTAGIDFAISLCKSEGIEALHLEADHFNERAHDLYLRLGFKDHKRHLMTKWL
jgi:ribosomal protein S18 acetylase RimI-like enzyme